MRELSMNEMEEVNGGRTPLPNKDNDSLEECFIYDRVTNTKKLRV